MIVRRRLGVRAQWPRSHPSPNLGQAPSRCVASGFAWGSLLQRLVGVCRTGPRIRANKGLAKRLGDGEESRPYAAGPPSGLDKRLRWRAERLSGGMAHRFQHDPKREAAPKAGRPFLTRRRAVSPAQGWPDGLRRSTGMAFSWLVPTPEATIEEKVCTTLASGTPPMHRSDATTARRSPSWSSTSRRLRRGPRSAAASSPTRGPSGSSPVPPDPRVLGLQTVVGGQRR